NWEGGSGVDRWSGVSCGARACGGLCRRRRKVSAKEGKMRTILSAAKTTFVVMVILILLAVFGYGFLTNIATGILFRRTLAMSFRELRQRFGLDPLVVAALTVPTGLLVWWIFGRLLSFSRIQRRAGRVVAMSLTALLPASTAIAWMGTRPVCYRLVPGGI